jgi:2-polyprenyl-3-methyl-5-hydroxy-6-metoxy-1,4-benzoquinol methylase
MGFFRLTGIDCSKSLLSVSKDKNCYETLDQCAFGMDYTEVPEKHIGKYDFVISASMINNDGFDQEVFKHLLSCLKLGGFVIFATKLNFTGEDQYESDIRELSNQQYWTYTA